MQTDDKPAITPKQVAEWMVEQLEEEGELPQKSAVLQIKEMFGDDFVCPDPYGDLGIARKVLYQFRKLTEGTVVWVVAPDDWTTGYWRKRVSMDRAGRKQPYY